MSIWKKNVEHLIRSSESAYHQLKLRGLRGYIMRFVGAHGRLSDACSTGPPHAEYGLSTDKVNVVGFLGMCGQQAEQ